MIILGYNLQLLFFIIMHIYIDINNIHLCIHIDITLDKSCPVLMFNVVLLRLPNTDIVKS